MATKDEKNQFSETIILRAENLNIDYMDAIITYCEEIGIEMDTAASLINETLKARIAEEAEALNFIEKTSRLPL